MQPGHVIYPLTRLIDKVRHFCKFRENGCNTKDFLVDLTGHEKKCVHKTIKCPQTNCRKEVILSKFWDHAVNSDCCALFQIGSMDQTAEIRAGMFVRSSTDKTLLKQKNKTWRLFCFEASAEKFYVDIHYMKNLKLLVLYVATGPTEIYYQAKMKIVDDNNPRQNISIIRDVIPLDEASVVSSTTEALLAEKRCWFVPKFTLDSFHDVETDCRGVSRMPIRVIVNIIR